MDLYQFSSLYKTISSNILKWKKLLQNRSQDLMGSGPTQRLYYIMMNCNKSLGKRNGTQENVEQAFSSYFR